jgi:hypothetical protein
MQTRIAVVTQRAFPRPVSRPLDGLRPIPERDIQRPGDQGASIEVEVAAQGYGQMHLASIWAPTPRSATGSCIWPFAGRDRHSAPILFPDDRNLARERGQALDPSRLGVKDYEILDADPGLAVQVHAGLDREDRR